MSAVDRYRPNPRALPTATSAIIAHSRVDLTALASERLTRLVVSENLAAARRVLAYRERLAAVAPASRHRAERLVDGYASRELDRVRRIGH